MKQAWEWLKGKKTYIGLAVGGVVVILQQIGVPMPEGVQINPHDYLQNLWELGLAAAVRHGISTEMVKAATQLAVNGAAAINAQQQRDKTDK